MNSNHLGDVVKATQESYAEMQLAYDFFNLKLFGGELPGALITFQRHSRSMGHYSKERYVDPQGNKADEINMNPAYFATRPVEDTLSTLVHEQAHQWRDRASEPCKRWYHDKIWAAKMKEIGLHPSSTGRPGGKELGEKVSHYVMPDGAFIRACKEFLRTNVGVAWYDRYPMAGGKDYEYASQSTVSVLAASQGTSPTEQEEGDESGERVDVPVFSAPPIETGLDVESPENEVDESGRPTGAKRTDSSNRVKYSCPKCRTNVWAKPGVNIGCVDCSLRFVAPA